jgi:hypothetical protein
MENAYFNGMAYSCPDCDYEWNENSGLSYSQENENLEFERLIKLKTPFFQLKHGKLYNCKVEHEKGIEELSIIPLAFEKGKNRQFVMIDARRLYNQNPKLVQQIIKMDFDYIMYDGIEDDFPNDYSGLTILCTTQNDGTMLDHNESVWFDFIETDEI